MFGEKVREKIRVWIGNCSVFADARRATQTTSQGSGARHALGPGIAAADCEPAAAFGSATIAWQRRPVLNHQHRLLANKVTGSPLGSVLTGQNVPLDPVC